MVSLRPKREEPPRLPLLTHAQAAQSSHRRGDPSPDTLSPLPRAISSETPEDTAAQRAMGLSRRAHRIAFGAGWRGGLVAHAAPPVLAIFGDGASAGRSRHDVEPCTRSCRETSGSRSRGRRARESGPPPQIDQWDRSRCRRLRARDRHRRPRRLEPARGAAVRRE